jgi:type III pantothenate kinase
MLVTIDIGNSNIVVGLPQGSDFDVHRYRTDPLKSSDEYYVLLKKHFEGATGIIISSVVPTLNEVFMTFIERYLSVPCLWVGPGIKTGIKLVTENPKEVGADLVAAAAGAVACGHDHAIIVDGGTATTITLMLDKEIKGVAISIGLDTARSCLVERASKLSSFAFETPQSVLGTTTHTALNTGFLYGHVFMIEGFIRKLRAAYPDTVLPVYLTGGVARLLKPLFEETIYHDETLLLKGLQAIYHKNA